VAYRLTADLIVILHAAFVLFVVFGGLLAWRWRRVVVLHLLAVLWGAVVEFAGLICPLTPLENHFRELGNQASYHDDFINHYVTAFLYPEGLTRSIQIALGLAVLLINVAIYARFFSVKSRGQRSVYRPPGR
jgi:uncharacterized membrane protein YqgA involved in biofilm formation